MKSNRQNIKSKLRPIIESILKEASPQFPFNSHDWLLTGLTLEDLITAVQSNEPTIDERSVTKVFNELVKSTLEDARYELKQNMQKIIKIASSNT